MTKQEYKIICKLIDMKVESLGGSFYNNGFKYFTEDDLNKLKDDIKELLVEVE